MLLLLLLLLLPQTERTMRPLLVGTHAEIFCTASHCRAQRSWGTKSRLHLKIILTCSQRPIAGCKSRPRTAVPLVVTILLMMSLLRLRPSAPGGLPRGQYLLQTRRRPKWGRCRNLCLTSTFLGKAERLSFILVPALHMLKSLPSGNICSPCKYDGMIIVVDWTKGSLSFCNSHVACVRALNLICMCAHTLNLTCLGLIARSLGL